MHPQDKPWTRKRPSSIQADIGKTSFLLPQSLSLPKVTKAHTLTKATRLCHRTIFLCCQTASLSIQVRLLACQSQRQSSLLSLPPSHRDVPTLPGYAVAIEVRTISPESKELQNTTPRQGNSYLFHARYQSAPRQSKDCETVREVPFGYLQVEYRHIPGTIAPEKYAIFSRIL